MFMLAATAESTSALYCSAVALEVIMSASIMLAPAPQHLAGWHALRDSPLPNTYAGYSNQP